MDRETMPEEWLNADSAETHYPMVAGFTKLMTASDYGLIDKYLDNAPLNDMSLLSKIGLIRTTYAARSKLNNWHETRDRIALTVDEPVKYLRGLFKD